MYFFNEYLYSINHKQKSPISSTIMTTQMATLEVMMVETREVREVRERLEWTADEAREYWEAEQTSEESIVIEDHSASVETRREWLEWLEETREEPREYWQADQMSDETEEEWMERRRQFEVTRREWEETREVARHEAARQADIVNRDTRWAWRWDAVHQEMMSWGDGEYEPNGYLTIPIIPLGIPLATVVWTPSWEDITKHIPVSISGLASFGQIHTISDHVNITGPPVIGVRV